MNQVLITAVIKETISNISTSGITIPMLIVEISHKTTDKFYFNEIPVFLNVKNDSLHLYYKPGTIILINGMVCKINEKVGIVPKQIYMMSDKNYKQSCKQRIALCSGNNWVNQVSISGEIDTKNNSIITEEVHLRGIIESINNIPSVNPIQSCVISGQLTENGIIENI